MLIKNKNKYTQFRPQIRSRHPSHIPLRNELPLLPFKTVVRLGSTTILGDETSKGGNRIELNSVEGIKNSSDKLLMKKRFVENNIKTANWFVYNENEGIFNLPNEEGIPITELPYPIIAKHKFGSKGTGNYKLDSQDELEQWSESKNTSNYIFEKFYSYSREYRLHVTKDGCFYTCRKMLKTETPENDRWRRHDDNCIWLVEENEGFDKPSNWDLIVNDAVKALLSVGLDIGAIDVKVQSSTTSKGKVRENPEWIILETNSAPSFGDITKIKYLDIIPKLLKEKFING